MNPNLLINTLKHGLKSKVPIKNKDIDILILSINLENEEIHIFDASGNPYNVKVPKHFKANSLKGLIEKQMNNGENVNDIRKIVITFYYKVDAKEYATLFFTNDTQKRIEL
jgi:hypothetical protein